MMNFFRLSLDAVQQARAHTDGKLVHLHAQQLCGKKVPEFMHGDEYAEQKDGEQDIQDILQQSHLAAILRPAASAARMSSRSGAETVGTWVKASSTKRAMS